MRVEGQSCTTPAKYEAGKKSIRLITAIQREGPRAGPSDKDFLGQTNWGLNPLAIADAKRGPAFRVGR